MREPAYSHEFPEDQAEVRIAALMTWFSPLMPAFWIPITKGLAPAPWPPCSTPDSRSGSLYATVTPTTRDPRM